MDGDLNDVRAQAVEILVERVTERFDVGDPNLAEALANTTVPLTLADDQYTRSADFDFETMAQLYVFKSIREFSDNYLQGHLERYPHLREWFNLDRVPTQQSFSHTWNNRFTRESRYALECAAIAIASVAVERDVIKAELAPEDPEDDEVEEDGKPKREYKRERTQQSVRSRENMQFLSSPPVAQTTRPTAMTRCSICFRGCARRAGRLTLKVNTAG